MEHLLPDKPILGTADLADFLGTTQAAVNNLARDHRLPPPLRYVKHRRWTRQAIERWLQEVREESQP
jgi:hypothetical protein